MVEYNKIYKKRDGRVLTASGPRESQRRQQNNPAPPMEDLATLREEIHSLRANLSKTPAQTDNTADKFDEILEEVSAELEQRYVDRISSLEALLEDRDKYIIKLEGRLDKQDALLQNITNKISAVPIAEGTAPSHIEEKTGRPGIDSVFIDPTAKGSEDKLESHVKTKETVSSKPTTSSNINKLKDLMGSKLPK